MIRKYIYGPGIDNPVAMINVSGGNETWYYYYADVLGSIRLITNSSGVVVESYTYDVYGQPRIMTSAGTDVNWLTEDVTTGQTSAVGNSIMFTGRWWDSMTKLYYYRFRDYSPTLGRFLQPDPAKYIDGMNLYAYCGNNPINWIDPWGLCSTPAMPDPELVSPHLVGPGLIVAGQPCLPKPRMGISGTKVPNQMTSPASVLCRNIPGRVPNWMSRISGTGRLGGTLGRAIPYIGGFLMLLDVALGPSEYELWQQERAEKFWRDHPPC